jgi:hypothetical protein
VFFSLNSFVKGIRRNDKTKRRKSGTEIHFFFFTGRVCGYLGEMVVQLITHTNILCKSSAGYLPAVMIF